MRELISSAVAILAALFFVPGLLAVSAVGLVLMFAPAAAVPCLFGGMLAAAVGAVLLMLADSI